MTTFSKKNKKKWSHFEAHSLIFACPGTTFTVERSLVHATDGHDLVQGGTVARSHHPHVHRLFGQRCDQGHGLEQHGCKALVG